MRHHHGHDILRFLLLFFNNLTFVLGFHNSRAIVVSHGIIEVVSKWQHASECGVYILTLGSR